MEWVKLGDVAEVVTGNTPRKNNNEYYSSDDIPFIKPDLIKDLLGLNYLEDSEYFISNLAREKSRIVPYNSVLLTCIGIIGKVGIVKANEIAFNQQINALIPTNIYYKYLAYCLLYNKLRLQETANSAVVPIINKSELRNFKIFIDKSDENQKNISYKLDLVSNLISTRKEQIAALDELVQSLIMKEITRAKKFEYIDEIFELIDGDRGKNYPKKEDFANEGYCLFLNAKNVTKSGFNFENLQFISEAKDKSMRKGKVERGDMILTTRGTVGNVAIYSNEILFDNVRINSGMIIMRPVKIVNLKFYEYAFRYSNIFKENISGSAQPQLPASTIKNIQIPLPPLKLQEQFAAKVEAIETQKAKLQTSLEEMETLFDALMQEAFSGNLG